jgi:hypothetical protein
MAGEGADMNDVNPPRWAEGLLRLLSRPSDRDSISGDFLEEYRMVRRPELGRLGANTWYILHVLSVTGRVLGPFAVMMIALKSLTRFVPVPNASLLQVPGVSAQDAAVCLMSGYYVSQRTGLIRAGALAAAVTNVIGVGMILAVLVGKEPMLVGLALRAHKFLFFPSMFLLIGLAFGLAIGSFAGLIGRCLPLPSRGPAQT